MKNTIKYKEITNLKLALLLLVTNISFSHANEADKFSIEVTGKNELITLTSPGQRNATDFTVHDPDYGAQVLCAGEKDRYSFHASTSNSSAAEMKIEGSYSGDKRKSCDNVSSDIKSVYWVLNFENIFYYDSLGSIRNCFLSESAESGFTPQNINEPYVTYDLLPDTNKLKNTRGIPMSAVFAKDPNFELFVAQSDQLLAMGSVDNRDVDSFSIPQKINDATNCDPRLGDSISLKNLATYTYNYDHTIEFGENATGVKLIEPGAKDYPAYQFKIVNKTNHSIKILSDESGSNVQYCQNPAGWQTEDYVFAEAAKWVAAATSAANNSSEYFIEDVANYVENQQLDKVSSGKVEDIFSTCADDIAPTTISLSHDSDIIAANKTQVITKPVILDNFDKFYDIQLTYKDIATNKTYTYNLSPNSSYKPITFNQGFHVITFEIDNSNQVTVTSQPDVPYEIVNRLLGGPKS